MESEKGIEDSEREIIGKKSIRDEILKLLKSSKYGRNISQIAEKLNMSRNTVKKYIEQMERESLIEVKEIGRSKIGYYKKNYEDSTAKGYVNFIHDFFNSMLKGVEKVASTVPNPQKMLREIGNEMGHHLPWPPLEAIERDKKVTITQIQDVVIKMLDFFNALLKIVKVEQIPGTSDENSSVIFKIENISKRIEDNEYFYHINIGFFESKIREIYGDNIYIEIIEYQKHNKCCYCRLEIR